MTIDVVQKQSCNCRYIGGGTVAESSNNFASERVRSMNSLDIVSRKTPSWQQDEPRQWLFCLTDANLARRLQKEKKSALVTRSTKTRRILTFGPITWSTFRQTVNAMSEPLNRGQSSLSKAVNGTTTVVILSSIYAGAWTQRLSTTSWHVAQ